MNEIESFPLHWPPMWTRTAKRQASPFQVTFAVARDDLLEELRLLGARNVIISSNVPIRRDGLPYSQRQDPEDPAVAVYFTLNGEQRVIPCDKWIQVRSNLRAIGLTVAALRGLSRWGAHEMVAAAFAGFAALPAGADHTPRPWRAVLEVALDADRTTVDAAYRRLVKVWHPDVCGGDDSRFLEIQAAYEQAKMEVPA